MTRTENEIRWTSSAGPIQTKKVEKAINAFRIEACHHIELTGVVGGECRKSKLWAFCAEQSEQSRELETEVFTRFDGEITRDNYKDIIAAYADAMKQLELPVIDNRRSQADEAELLAKQAERQAERIEADKKQAEIMERVAACKPDGAQWMIVAECQENKSDPMTDYYAHSVERRVLIGWQTTKKTDFRKLRQAAGRFEPTAHLEHADKEAEHRENYSMGGGNYLKAGWRNSNGWAVRLYSIGQCVDEIADHVLDPPAPESGDPAADYQIEKHYHSKRNCDIWLCVPVERMERDAFDAERDRAKRAGGWYSRAWQGTPGGFAFVDEATAQAFCGGGQETNLSPAERLYGTLGDRFREMAINMQAKIDDLRAERNENTPKRQREGMSRRIEANHLERTQKALNTLADLETIPPLLAGYRTKKAIHDALRTRTTSNGYYHVGDTFEYADESPEAKALQDLIEFDAAKAKKDQEATERENSLKFADIPGFFPTPADLAAEMVDALDPQPADAILEPSAGKGDLIQAVLDRCDTVCVLAIEPNVTCASVLSDKFPSPPVGVTCSTFEDTLLDLHKYQARYERIIMNPPFERGLDAKHVRAAFGLLKPGGRLVALVGGHIKADFQEWLDSVDANVTPLGDRFKNAFRQTGVNVAMVVIDREGI